MARPRLVLARGCRVAGALHSEPPTGLTTACNELTYEDNMTGDNKTNLEKRFFSFDVLIITLHCSLIFQTPFPSLTLPLDAEPIIPGFHSLPVSETIP